MKRRNIFSAIFLIIIVCLVVIMVIDLFPLVKEVIESSDNESNMVQYIDSYGAKGIPILMGLQALQIIIAFIPSAAIQMLTGLCYGVWRGALINLAGCILGNIMVFVALRQMKQLFSGFFKRERTHRKSISKEQLSKIKKPEMVAFFFFLIPGIPNGIVPYVFAETDIPLPKYIAAVVAGSIPSTLLCTYLGDRISKGSYTTAIIIAVVIAVLVLIVMRYKNKLMEKVVGGSNAVRLGG